MIKLDIKVQPKSTKYLEFSQSLESIKSDLKQLCASLLITEENNTFSLIADINSPEQLTKMFCSKELSILSGAIKTLGEKSEIIIHGAGYKKKGFDLREFRLDYLKQKK